MRDVHECTTIELVSARTQPLTENLLINLTARVQLGVNRVQDVAEKFGFVGWIAPIHRMNDPVRASGCQDSCAGRSQMLKEMPTRFAVARGSARPNPFIHAAMIDFDELQIG